MASEWYIQRSDGHIEGPFSPVMLKTLAQQGQVTLETLVRLGETSNWVTASHVKGLFGPELTDVANASRLVPCADCAKPISRLASLCPSCGCPAIKPTRPDKYPALQGIAAINKIFAGVVLVGCLIGLLIISQNAKGTESSGLIISLFVYMVIAPLALWGTAEIILLLIGIANNTSTLRGMTSDEQKVKEISVRLLGERSRESEEKNQAKYHKARQKLSPDLHAVLGTSGNAVAVRVELVKSITIGALSNIPLRLVGFRVIDNRPWKERFMGRKTAWVTGYIDVARIADLALLSEVQKISSWEPDPKKPAAGTISGW